MSKRVKVYNGDQTAVVWAEDVPGMKGWTTEQPSVPSEVIDMIEETTNLNEEDDL